MRFVHNFWLEGPIDLRPTRLNCILQDLFRDTPLDHIWGAQIRAQICQIWPNMPNMHIWVHIWARAIWSSGVSLKRSCKMQFRRVGLRSIGPSSQKLWPNQIFGRFPHCNYNVKLKMVTDTSKSLRFQKTQMFSQMIDQKEHKNNRYKFEPATWCYKHHSNRQGGAMLWLFRWTTRLTLRWAKFKSIMIVVVIVIALHHLDK